MKDFLKRNFWNLLLIVLVGCFTYFGIVKRAAVNMDEFSQYHALICNNYEFNKLNVFREACGSYDLVLPGTGISLPLRSYGYAGSLADLYYYPLFLLWKSYESARMLGFVFILLQAWVLAKILKTKFSKTLIGLVLFFPYYYQIIIDTGLVQFYTTAVLFVYYFMQRWFVTHKWPYIVGTGALLFLMIYSRLSFVFGVPTLAMIFLAFAWQKRLSIRKDWRRLLKQCLVAAAVMGIPMLLYFFSTSAVASGQYPVLAEIGRGSHSLLDMLKPSTYLDSELLRRFFDPLQATSRAYTLTKISIPSLIYTVILFGTPVITVIVQMISWLKHRGKVNKKLVMFLLAFLLTVIFLFKSLDTKHMHHAMMAYPFIVLAWGYLIPDLLHHFGKIAKVFLAGCLIFNLYYYVIFTNNKIEVSDDPSKIEVNQILNNNYLASHYFYAVTNWGMYFYQGLYGPEQQSVLYLEGLLTTADVPELQVSYTKEDVQNKLATYSEKYKRQVLYIYKKTENVKADLLAIDPTLVECSQTQNSKVWGILIPADMEPTNPCK